MQVADYSTSLARLAVELADCNWATDHTYDTYHTYHTYHTDHSHQECICPDRSRSRSICRRYADDLPARGCVLEHCTLQQAPRNTTQPPHPLIWTSEPTFLKKQNKNKTKQKTNKKQSNKQTNTHGAHACVHARTHTRAKVVGSGQHLVEIFPPTTDASLGVCRASPVDGRRAKKKSFSCRPRTDIIYIYIYIYIFFSLFLTTSDGSVKIKLKLTTLPRANIRAVCQFNPYGFRCHIRAGCCYHTAGAWAR